MKEQQMALIKNRIYALSIEIAELEYRRQTAWTLGFLESESATKREKGILMSFKDWLSDLIKEDSK